MRNFTSLAYAADALIQLGYRLVASNGDKYGFTKGQKHAIVTGRPGTKFKVKFI